ncbi:MAG: zinc ribbon domain-containing protein [Mycobacterium sp.]
MAVDLETLLAVQDRDIELDRLDLRRRELPERAVIADIEKRVSAIDTELRQVGAERDELVGRQSTLERDVASAVERVHQIEARMYGGQVSASRELQAMADEVQSLQRRRSVLEDQVVDLMEQVEPVELTMAGLESQLDALGADALRVKQDLARAEKEIDAEMGAEQKARADLANALPAELSTRYERIRRRLGGVGAARLVGGSCGGCHLSLPAMELDRIRHARPDEVLVCDQCGRILVP